MIRSSISEIDSQGDICILQISNGKKNKITVPEFVEINELDNFIKTHNSKGLVITGNDRNFSDGADVSMIDSCISNPEELTEKLRKGKELLYYIENLPIITAAAINGACFGAGLEIALSCQFRFSKSNAFFAFPEVSRGIIPGMSGVERLTRLIGKSSAVKMALSGEMITAQQAFDSGLIDEIVTDTSVLDSCLNFVNDLTESRSLGQIKSIVMTANNSVTVNKFSDMDYFEQVLSDKKV
ncbi:MAG: enoyl-CoA hydratase/isomerase family protein [Oscillospiraceae bacterium]|nr:enoyl-CoA hydratase/isomerase family protein [Oscillospiraceae bacterium]